MIFDVTVVSLENKIQLCNGLILITMNQQYKAGKSLTVDVTLLAEAKKLDLNLNKIFEDALKGEIEAKKSTQIQKE